MIKSSIFLRNLLFFLSIIQVTIPAYSSVVIQNTRVIYPANKKHISVQLLNNSSTPSLVQSWIDGGDIDSTPETTTAPFIVTPPIKKISAYNGTELKIYFLEQELPQDRESIFYFNVLDISPKTENARLGNRLQFTIQTRIKLFYRPVSLLNKTEKTLHDVKFSATNQSIIIDNPTPFFITIANISLNKNKLLNESVMLNPFSKKEVKTDRKLSAGKIIDIDFIRDSGDYTTISKKIL